MALCEHQFQDVHLKLQGQLLLQLLAIQAIVKDMQIIHVLPCAYT